MRELQLAAAALLGWLPFLWRPLSPDEGGLLLVASQWGPGSSLYGDYWVDRPPVLIGLFALVDGIGDPWALRLLGCLAVVLTVLLAAMVGRLAAPATRFGPVLAASTAAVFTATPLFGGSVVNSEILALPFILAGLAAAVAAATRSGLPAMGLAAAAGAAGALAALTKQSQLDVFVAVLVLALVTRRGRLLLGAVAGAGLTLLVALQVSHGLGTPPGELWHAVVTFRGEAAQVIAASSTEATPRRFAGMTGALVATAAPFVAVGLLVRLRGPATYGVVDLRRPALAVLGWELLVVLLGGSFWLHYLMGLVPGLVLLAAAAAQRRLEAGPTLVLPYAAAVVSALVTIAYVVAVPIERKEAPVIDYLQAEAEPGDTAVVAFGGANILRETGMASPYEGLWSLPVRVRDPELADLTAVLLGDEAPTWVVTQGLRADTWGVDGAAADRALRDRYRIAATTDDFTIFRLDR
jgi:4-amino-4-deoxy-L-arabinose transferase-like glycosyltransferase